MNIPLFDNYTVKNVKDMINYYSRNNKKSIIQIQLDKTQNTLNLKIIGVD